MEPILERKNDLQIKANKRNKNEKEYLSHLIRELYISLYPECPKHYNLPKNFENLIFRILSSNFNVLRNNETIIVNSLLEKVNKNSRNNVDTINKFQNLYSRLIKKRTLSKRWCILYLLNHFSKNSFKTLSFSATNELQKNFLNAYDILNNKTDNTFHELFFEDSYNNIQDNYILSENKNSSTNDKEKCEYYLKNLSPISDINEKFCDNESQINADSKSINLQNPIIFPLVVNPSKTSLTITEKDIINDLIYTFEGINSKYIVYDEKEDAFILNKLLPWSEEIYNIVNSLSELGWLYKKIKKYLDIFKKYKASKSQFIQSFIYAVQKELDEYFKLISFFKKMNNSQKRGKKLNLKNLFLWTLEPKEKLKWIATCCETISNLKGTAIFSQIYSLKKYLGCNDYLDKLLNDVSKPFLTFILNWIKYGYLEDPFKEFFVDIIEGINSDDIWKLKYQLVAKNVPHFMKRDITVKIFEVGKVIHFLKNYCKVKFDLSSLKESLNNLINKNENKKNDSKNAEEKDKDKLDLLKDCYNFINYLFNNKESEKIFDISLIYLIDKQIDLIHTLINEELVKIIFNKFKFSANLESINKYLLLGQGDMMQTLIESIFEELDKPANMILKHNLDSYLTNAIKASNSDVKDSENIKKINIILLNEEQGDIGWDIFCLEYNVDSPLNVIFNNKLLKDYQKIFLFFWKIKRVQYSQINHIWKKIKNLNYNSNKIKKNPFLKKLINTSIIFNQEIFHFISNLHNYFSLEVLETQYKKLQLDLNNIKNLDELIHKHKIFVENIKKQCLLEEGNKSIIIKISEIFDVILKFKKVFDVLYSFTYEINYENNYNFKRIKNIEEYVKQIDSLYNEYKRKVIEFIQLIDLIGRDNIKYLSMKLDYNYYYSSIEKEKNDEKDVKIIKNINKEKIRQQILQDDDYSSNYENSENNKNNNDDNIIIDKNKFNSEKVNPSQNNINNEMEINEDEEKLENEVEEVKGGENVNDFNNIDLNNEKKNININKITNLKERQNNLIYIKKKYNDINNMNSKYINIGSDKHDIDKSKKYDFNINNNINEENPHQENTNYEYENYDSDEKDLSNENNELNGEENNCDNIDDEDKIVTNIIPKVYGISAKQKQKDESDDKK